MPQTHVQALRSLFDRIERDPTVAVLVVTHDESLLHYIDQRIGMCDGQTEGEGVPARAIIAPNGQPARAGFSIRRLDLAASVPGRGGASGPEGIERGTYRCAIPHSWIELGKGTERTSESAD